MRSVPACAVLGLGNVLMHDDGFGPYAARTFAAACEPHPDVAIIDVGTPGLDLVPYLMVHDAVIVLDTIRLAGAAPGTIHVRRRDELLALPPKDRLSPHDPGLGETLLLLELQGSAPADVVLVGVVPETVDTHLGLGDAVKGAVSGALDAVAAELARLGHPVTWRARPEPPDLWWLREMSVAAATNSALPSPIAGR